MNGSAALDNSPWSCCVAAKREQADNRLAPSVNYGVEFYRFISLCGLEIVGSEILRPYRNPPRVEENSRNEQKTACTASLTVHAVLFYQFMFSY